MNALIAWLGGKSRLADIIIKRIPPHTCYVEVFCGGAHVYFTKSPSKVEVINDINGELVNLYRVAKEHLEEFIKQFKYLLVSREQYDRFQSMAPNVMTDIQRAVRFYYTMKMSFGAKVTGQNYGYSSTTPPRLNLLRVEEDLSAAHIRLARTNIENLPYSACISKYDSPETFMYLDPPYYDCENDYGVGIFGKEDFVRLRDILSAVSGKFMVSINDVPQIREIFKDFRIEEVKTVYTVGDQKEVPELLITNYEPIDATPSWTDYLGD